MYFIYKIGAVLSLMFSVTTAHATTVSVSLNPFSSSHCIQSASICFGDQNRGASILDGGAAGIRHFMVFDFSELEGTVVSAELNIDAGEGAYRTFSPSMSYTITSFSAELPMLTERATGSAASTIYNAIGSGDVVGSTTISTPINNFRPQPMPGVSVDLGGGLSALTDAFGGIFALGGRTFGHSLFTFDLGHVGSDAVSLNMEIEQSSISPVPLPATMPLIALSLFGLFSLGRRRL